MLLGLDIGSSSVKASLVEAESGKVLASGQYPETEMDMISLEEGWAEQNPSDWWENVKSVIKKVVAESGRSASEIKSIGIGYQMHGLVCVDSNQEVLRPAIIWCDSRAVSYGDKAFEDLGHELCLQHYLNSPGNFTASKLKWVKENEPDVFAQIDKIMLPGDYIAMKLTGEILTTTSGLSEGILWDFKEHKTASKLMSYYGLDESLIPEIRDTFSDQGKVKSDVAQELGFSTDIIVGYRAGDQPNNALALNVLNPGEVAATAGTSGVVYGVTDRLINDTKSRVNGFAHVNHSSYETRVGVLLCVNGTGRLYSWLKNQLVPSDWSYVDMEKEAEKVSVGSEGLSIIPFGNGAERILENKLVEAHVQNLQLNRHGLGHMIRASLEGIAFGFTYGMKIMEEMGVDLSLIRAGDDNMFQSEIFSQTVAELTGAQIELVHTTGSTAAAVGGAKGAGLIDDVSDVLGDLPVTKTYKPTGNNASYLEAYDKWIIQLKNLTK